MFSARRCSPFDDAPPAHAAKRGLVRNPDWFAALGYGVPMSMGSFALASVLGPTSHVLGVAWFGLGLCAMGLVGYLASAR